MTLSCTDVVVYVATKILVELVLFEFSQLLTEYEGIVLEMGMFLLLAMKPIPQFIVKFWFNENVGSNFLDIPRIVMA